MNTSYFTRQLSRSSFAVLALVAVLVTSSLSAASAGAQPLPDPNTIISNDGAVIDTTSVKTVAGLVEDAVQPVKGSGLPSAEAQQDIDLDTKLGSATLPISGTDTTSLDIAHTQALYSDGRYPIYDPTGYPDRAIVALTLDNGGGSYRCSGFLISPNTVATAGHCLHFNGGWSYNVRAYPGYTGSSAPYGSCGYRSLYSVYGWTVDKNPEYDYGVIKLDCEIGQSTGWLGFRWQAASLDGVFVHAQGYPDDKGWEQWGHSGKIYLSQIRNTYSSYTYGLNGAPIIDENGYVVSIFNSPIPFESAPNGYYSRGTRITEEVYNNLLYWQSL